MADLIVPIPNRRIKNITGNRYSHLAVVGFAGLNKRRDATWLCNCDCGGTVVVRLCSLVDGNTTSCGCVKRIQTRRNLGKNAKHRMCKTRIYGQWAGMLARCRNPNSSAFSKYGAKGISVCDRWLNFENFFADMGDRPSNAHSIDRFPNLMGNYEPGNCRWATMKQQQNNRSNNRLVCIDGKTMTLMQCCDAAGVDYWMVKARIYRGWTIERALNTPVLC